jgi:hypothetical protein
MHHKRLACALMGAMAAVVSAESDVTQLTGETFNDFIKGNDLVLAECKSLFARLFALLLELFVSTPPATSNGPR